LTLLVVLSALAADVWSQSLLETSLTFLQRHGVPCVAVVKIDSSYSLDEVAICEDGRQWVLFWLEDEIAFIQPSSRELFRWRREVFDSYPSYYRQPTQISQAP
jgi:hypothetical protein